MVIFTQIYMMWVCPKIAMKTGQNFSFEWVEHVSTMGWVSYCQIQSFFGMLVAFRSSIWTTPEVNYVGAVGEMIDQSCRGSIFFCGTHPGFNQGMGMVETKQLKW